MKRRHARSAGAAILSAIFLIVVLAALGASMASLTSVQQDTQAKSMLAAKVYYGAKSGLDWAIQRTISDPAPPTRCNSFPGAAFPLSGTGFEGVSVAVTCTPSQHGGGSTVFTYYLTSEARTGTIPSTTVGVASPLDYAQRRMEATVTNIP